MLTLKMKLNFKNDKYKKARGGYSRLLDIACENCGTHLFYYQKDGPGILKRMYFDRIYDSSTYTDLSSVGDAPQLTCPKCRELIGVPIIHKKEKRPAFRLFVGTVTKKITKS